MRSAALLAAGPAEGLVADSGFGEVHAACSSRVWASCKSSPLLTIVLSPLPVRGGTMPFADCNVVTRVGRAQGFEGPWAERSPLVGNLTVS